MRVQPTTLAGVAVAVVLAVGAPAAHAVGGSEAPSDRKAAPGDPAAVIGQQIRADGGVEDGGKSGGSHKERSREEGRKSRGSAHTGGGGLAVPGGGLASGTALMGAGLVLGAYALRLRRAAGGAS
ncbi:MULTISPECIES: hypothetical protein [Kitasatospora]|uniref:Gram-positive cocci surface proteins LPxTG domain-containing protein n=1 Tax=Kitasatospora cystarginea TaxID=58350 RepID=A0ABP5Q787_9ACTN